MLPAARRRPPWFFSISPAVRIPIPSTRDAARPHPEPEATRSREEAIRRYRFLPGVVQADEETRRQIAAHSVRREADGRFGYKFDPRWFGVPPRSRPDLRDIRCPTLLLRGEDSALLTREGALEIVSAISDAHLVEIPNARATTSTSIDLTLVLVAMLEFLSRHGLRR